MEAHNRQLDFIAESIYNAPLPANTTVLRRNVYVGNLGGSGDACDYIAEQTMQTTLARAEVLAHYHITQSSSHVPIGRGIALLEPAQYYRTEIDQQFVNIIVPDKQLLAERLVFILQIMDGRDDAGFDIRCL